MDYKYLTGLILISCLPLSGCNLTEDDKKKLDKAGENLEKVALKPLISFPTDNDNIRGPITIIIDTDPTIEHKSVTLKVMGREVATDTEAPFEFDWQPYFWSTEEQSQVTLQVTAITADDSYLRSDLINVTLNDDLKDTLNIITPASDSSIQNIDSTQLQWAPLSGAQSYEYQLNEQNVVATTKTSATLSLPSTGNYSVKVRATNEDGQTGAWTNIRYFRLDKPIAPSFQSPQVSKVNNEWSINLSWNNGLGNTEIEIATDNTFNSILENTITESSSINKTLPTGKYYARARSTNSLGHTSEWSQTSVIIAGLFSHKIDMATYGWDSGDAPIDLVLNEQDTVILARKSNNSDGSGDDFYVTKINYDGGKTWGKSYKNIATSPTSINKTSSGYLLTGSSTSNYRDKTIFEINESGTKAWQQDIQHNHDTDANTITSEGVTDAIEVSENQYAILHTSWLYNITAENSWGYTTEFVEGTHSIDFIDRSNGNSIISQNAIDNPESGEYTNLNKLLVSDSGLYATGRYKANNATGNANSDDGFTPEASTSGSFLLTLDSSDGSVISERTGGGLADSSINNLIELGNGELVTSYNNYYAGAVTNFASNANTSTSKINGAVKYSIIAPLKDGDYVMVGKSRSNDKKTVITRYSAENVQVGTSHTFDSCFYDLDIKSIKFQPEYGLIALGTDGYSYNSKYTVLFNITDDFQYLCPTVK